MFSCQATEYIYIYIHIYIYTYIHIYTHTHIYIYIFECYYYFLKTQIFSMPIRKTPAVTRFRIFCLPVCYLKNTDIKIQITEL
jgi:hypothetical protein